MLADYVPFYFTPWSMMLLNIATGYKGVTRRENGEIVFLCARLREVADRGHEVVFTDGHAYLQQTDCHRDFARLDGVDWDIL